MIPGKENPNERNFCPLAVRAMAGGGRRAGAINIVLLLLKLTRKLIFLAAGALLIAVGIYTGVIDAPVGLLALPFFAI